MAGSNREAAREVRARCRPLTVIGAESSLGIRPYDDGTEARHLDLSSGVLREAGLVARLGADDLRDVAPPAYRELTRPPGGARNEREILDYRVRIFTLARELPYAGHPTLGSCHAWLTAEGAPRDPDVIVQECGAGLIPVRRTAHGLAFSAPPLLRRGPVEELPN